MYADRYGPKPLDRRSLTLSVGIVGGLVAAAMLSPTVIRIVHHDPGLRIIDVAPPPPPPKPEPLPKPRARPQPSPMPRRTLVETPRPAKVDWTPPPEQPFTGELGASDAAGPPTVIETPKPPPVVTGIEVDPRYARDFQPLYPPAELREGRDGVVTLKVLVGADGRVARAEQVAATSDEFWRATLKQALAKWRFKPAMRDGVPFESWRTMTVRFRVEDQ